MAGQRRSKRLKKDSSDESEGRIKEPVKDEVTVEAMPLDYLEISIPDPTIVRPEVKEMKRAKDQSQPKRKINRALRMVMRRTHLYALIISLQLHSLYANHQLLQAVLISVCPPHISKHFSYDHRTLVNGLSMLANWWKNKFGFRIRSEGSVTPPTTFAYLHRLVLEGQAYEDELVLLFCCLLRGLGLKLRVVSSLSLLPVIPAEIEKESSESFTYSPVNWVEVYHAAERTWIPVDCVRGIVNCRQSMELGKARKQKERIHVLVMAVDSAGAVTDVTKRYCSKYYSAAWRLRQAEERPLERFILRVNNQRPKIHLYDEEKELEGYTESEPMPKTMAGFQAHGKYVLESKVRKYEVFWPADAVVGKFKEEPIHLRSSVQKVRSKEAWFTQFARNLRSGEEPVKTIQLPKRKKKGMLLPDEDPYEPGGTQHLYGEWQTEPYVPPVAENGQVPRNSHGNVDLFQPEMLPIGSSYIPYAGAWKAARELGVNYADACIGFSFHGRMAVPKIQGIVVCREEEQRVLSNYFTRLEKELAEESKASEKVDRIKRRRQLLSAEIADRLTAEYGAGCEDNDSPGQTIQSTFSKSTAASDDEFSFE